MHNVNFVDWYNVKIFCFNFCKNYINCCRAASLNWVYIRMYLCLKNCTCSSTDVTYAESCNKETRDGRGQGILVSHLLPICLFLHQHPFLWLAQMSLHIHIMHVFSQMWCLIVIMLLLLNNKKSYMCAYNINCT